MATRSVPGQGRLRLEPATRATRPEPSPATSFLSVSDLARRVRETIETRLRDYWVAGEVSSLTIAASGHVYFTLKDQQSQFSAVMFRSAAQRLRFRPENGMDVVVHGRVGFYEPRGAIQFYAEAMEPRGVGAQQLAIEQLKKRLAAEGLFAAERKRPLPAMPKCVGILTALRGAAVHDMTTTMHARFPGVRVLVRPVRVQGQGAAEDIITGLNDLLSTRLAEVIIVGRGGGSREDLWAFNDEHLARAIAAAPVPIVSAVGHQIDQSITDLVADACAATPTAAGAMVVPDQRELTVRIDEIHDQLDSAIRRKIQYAQLRVDALARRVRHPKQNLAAVRQRVDEWHGRALRAIHRRVENARHAKLRFAERLDALSPLAVLDRGYAIAQRADGEVVRDAKALQANETLRVRFSRGSAVVRVDSTEHNNEE